ncbi:M20/M25/M40 family metallo-hydrolase [Myxococcota bacterium]|nr:M20/M25/M40 family metallo-hydrolase [Myxococcota bacterium]
MSASETGTSAPAAAILDALDWDEIRRESLQILRDLIRIDTTNPPGGEISACHYLAAIFQRERIDYDVFESAPGRGNIVARLGSSGEAPPVLLSAHLDVVAADPRTWTHPPFAAEVHGGYVWGRGAIDMKNMAAMEVACLLAARRSRIPLRRDLLFAGVADEEAGCRLGSLWLAEHHPETIRGEYAISEIGGFTLNVGRARYYPVQIAEKGICWLTVKARGTPGHGSLPNRDNPLIHIGKAAQALGLKMLPMHRTEVVDGFVEGLASRQPALKRMVLKQLLNPRLSDLILDRLMPDESLANSFRAALHNTANPTSIGGGDKINVVPGEAFLRVDGRTLPGQSPETLIAELRALLGSGYDIQVDQTMPPTEGSFDDPLAGVIGRAIARHDPGALVLPYLAPGFTDAKAYSQLGMKCWGFSPVRLAPEDSFARWFHGNDERIPVEGFHFGVRALAEVVFELVT